MRTSHLIRAALICGILLTSSSCRFAALWGAALREPANSTPALLRPIWARCTAAAIATPLAIVNDGIMYGASILVLPVVVVAAPVALAGELLGYGDEPEQEASAR